MIREVEYTEIIREKKRYCDLCGSLAKTHCCQCGIDLCNKCVESEDYDGGDYRGNCYCKQCWEIGDEYRKATEICETEIERLSNEYSHKCKRARESKE